MMEITIQFNGIGMIILLIIILNSDIIKSQQYCIV